jgi:hypothetical protein
MDLWEIGLEDVTGSGSWSVAGFSITGIEPLVYSVRE